MTKSINTQKPSSKTATFQEAQHALLQGQFVTTLYEGWEVKVNGLYAGMYGFPSTMEWANSLERKSEKACINPETIAFKIY